MHLAILIYNTFLRIKPHRTATQNMGCDASRQDALHQRPGWNAIRPAGKKAGDPVSQIYFYRDGFFSIILGDQVFPEECVQAAPHAHAQTIIYSLHHQQDGAALRPTRQDMCAEEI